MFKYLVYFFEIQFYQKLNFLNNIFLEIDSHALNKTTKYALKYAYKSMVKFWDWRDRKVSRAFVLHHVDSGSTPATLYNFQVVPGVIPRYRVRNKL